MKVTIRWITRNNEYIKKLKEKFNIPDDLTVNKLTSFGCEDIELLRECDSRGFVKIINYEKEP